MHIERFMVITRKIISVIAKALHESKPHDADTVTFNWLDLQWREDVNSMADALASLNDKFDKERFIEFCKQGFDPKG